MCPALEESDWSNMYVSPSRKVNLVVGPEASIRNLLDAIVTAYVMVAMLEARMFC